MTQLPLPFKENSETPQMTTMSAEVRDLLENHEKEMRFLFDLRASGSVNMFGAGSVLAEEFDLTSREGISLTAKWMSNFEQLSELLGYKD